MDKEQYRIYKIAINIAYNVYIDNFIPYSCLLYIVKKDLKIEMIQKRHGICRQGSGSGSVDNHLDPYR